MDLTTVAGLLLAVALLSWSLSLGGASAGTFVHGPSALAVCGGTLAVTLLGSRTRDLRGLLEVLKQALVSRLPSPRRTIERIGEHAEFARTDGLLALETRLLGIGENFFAKGVRLVIDGFSAQAVRDLLDLESAGQQQRLAAGRSQIEGIGRTALACGAIGTLVGLVHLFANLGDLSTVGGGLALALLTALYGALLAGVVCNPLATRLELLAREEALLRELAIEGVVAIQAGAKPQAIRERLEHDLVARRGTRT